MKKILFTTIALMFVLTISKAQTTALQIKGNDCNGNPQDIYADMDAGKVIILHFFMPSCGSCPPPAQKIQKMANNILKKYPGKVKGIAMPFQNSTTCEYTSTWVSSNGLSFYAPVDSGAVHVANYGGFGMPTVVVVGGKDHKVLFSTLDFSTSDTTIMRDKIIALLEGTSSITNLPISVSTFKVFPNPATENITITIDLKEKTNLELDITDITGKQIAVILNEKQNGQVIKQFNTSSLPNGNYLVRLLVNGKSVMQKLTVNH